MAIPRTRQELSEQVERAWTRLDAELEAAGPRLGSRPCLEEWTVKELLAVRAWWSEQVVAWVEAGRRGESPETPAPGYRWNETPRLNHDIARRARRESYRAVRTRLAAAHAAVAALIPRLDDAELLEPGHFSWTGKWPVARWISINTARQYATARTAIRRVVRSAGS